MSAIWGKINQNNSLIEQSEQMIMKKPYEEKCRLDRIEEYCEKNLLFACGIQEVTEESKYERLPIVGKTSVFTADCLLDNRKELEGTLKTQQSIPDGELFQKAYEKWGNKCFEKVEGLYSVAIWEKETQTLILAVDRMAYRCLYYKVTDGEIFFSTLLEPLLLLQEDVEINDLYMRDFLTANGMLPNITDHETPYKGIYQVKPGTFVTIHKNKVEEHRYWSPEMSAPKYTYKNADVCGKEFRDVLEKCVASALRTSKNVAAALSSGFDSATVSSVAADLLKKDDKKLYTYTYVPAPEYNGERIKHNTVLNEKEDVLKIVAMHSNMIPEFVCNEGKDCFENIEMMQRVMEIPYKAYVNIPNLNEIYHKSAENGCKIVLLGQCGNSTISFGLIDDVLFDLYQNGHYLKMIGWLNNYSKVINESRKEAIAYCFKMYRYSKKTYAQNQFIYKMQNEWIDEKILENYPIEERYRESGRVIFKKIPVDQKKYREDLYSTSMYTYLGAMETKLGLYNGLVLRDPTRDSRIVSFCYHMPFQYFAYKGITRWLIRKQCADLLPSDITANYLRYGVQNVDWLERIKKRRFEILKNVESKVKESSYSKYYDLEKVKDFLSANAEAEDWDEYAFMNLMYLFMEGNFEHYVRTINKKASGN